VIAVASRFGWTNRGLIAGCEAFLAGRYVEYLDSWGWLPPPWVWMNLLAHGTDAELARLAHARPEVSCGRRLRWEQARRYLAGEVLDAAARHGSLEALQTEVLVPLEFELMAEDGESTPSRWAARVLGALAPIGGGAG
jgi:hypothetical protein